MKLRLKADGGPRPRPHRAGSGRLLLIRQFELKLRFSCDVVRIGERVGVKLGQPVLGDPERRGPEGHRRGGALEGRRPAELVPVQGHLGLLHLRPAHPRGRVLRFHRHRWRWRRPAGLRRIPRRGIVVVGARTVPSGDQDAVVVPKGSPDHLCVAAQGQEDRVRHGQFGQLPAADRAERGGADQQAGHAGEPPAGRGARRVHLGLGRRLGHLAALRPAGRCRGRREGLGGGLSVRQPVLLRGRVQVRRSQHGESVPAIQVYLTTLDKAYVWAEKNPNAWGAAWANAARLPASITDAAAKVDYTVPVPITSAVTASLQGLVTQSTRPARSRTNR